MKLTKPPLRTALFASLLATGLLHAAAPPEALAQQAVVQPLPSPEVQRLNRALMELARRPNSVGTLLEAGDASLELGDFDAAIGFYGRAADIAPNDARVKLGLARVYLRSGRPIEAIPLFQQARSAGAAPRDVLPDQALAFDMVGDQEAAQAAYRRALELAPQNDEVRQRLALSYAISGNREAFESTIAPLVAAGKAGGLRARAFGLAILGDQERAEGIVNTVMPADIAQRINPYLGYMPRLTASQQAAAANLGIFPRAADIGRENPRIARFAAEGAAGSRLEPAGEPFGSSALEQTVSRQTAQAAPETAPQTAANAASGSPSAQLPEIVTRERPSEPPAPEPSVADAFADLGSGELPIESGASDAVDLSAIEIPREAPPKPAEPDHPRRIWVQVATGRDLQALRFDWRRFVRQAPELLGDFDAHVTPWGQANRLLAGPLDNASQARNLINALAELGISTFAYTSPEGTEIQRLDR